MASKEIPITGSCSEMPLEVVDEYFFDAPQTNHRGKILMAKRICMNCVALAECGEMALDLMPPYGIFAGMTPKERERLAGGDAA